MEPNSVSKIIVIDVETTGFSPYRGDRIVEIALVALNPEGVVLSEFTSLVNPERDVGPTRIHGIRASDVLSAPRFHELLPELLVFLSGTSVIVGHNLKFDYSFLEAEFGRAHVELPEVEAVCTLELAGGGSLEKVCKQYGVERNGSPHQALHDAQATASLFKAMIEEEPDLGRRIQRCLSPAWPVMQLSNSCALRRGEAPIAPTEASSFLKRLLPRVEIEPIAEPNAGAILAYSTLLARVLEDRIVEPEEADALQDLALRWSLSPSEIAKIHLDFLRRVQVAALEDGVITVDERNDIYNVAALLGVGSGNLDGILNSASETLQSLRSSRNQFPERQHEELKGKTVCFTGDMCGVCDGILVSREWAIKTASSHGMIPLPSVTRKLDLLVAADALSQSGKARKARDYGIPIWSDTQFWQTLDLKVRV